MKSLLFTLSLLIFFSACNQQPKKVNAKLQISTAHLIAGQSGGVMLYVTNKALNAQRAINLQNTEITLELDDGLWDFAVLAWAGGPGPASPGNPVGPLSGNLSCAKSSLDLKSTDRTIYLDLDPSHCNDDFFASSGYRSAAAPQVINPLQLIDCQDISGLSGGSSCSTAASIGNTLSYKIHLIAYPQTSLSQLNSINFNQQPRITSECINAPGSLNSVTSSGYKIPAGGTGIRPSFLIETFSTANCGTTTARKFYFPNGLGGLETTASSANSFSHSTNAQIFLSSGEMNVSGNLNIGSVEVSTTSVNQTLTITNFSPYAFSNISMSHTNNQFKFAGGFPGGTGSGFCTTNLNPGDSCFIKVTFEPNTLGSLTSTLAIAYEMNSQNKTISIPLSGQSLPCTVASIVWVTQPTTASAGSTMTTAPKVSLKKSDGNLCTTNYAEAIITIGTDGSTQGDASVSGNISVTPVNGYATFSSINVPRAGTNHTLIVKHGDVISPESSGFNINANTGVKLVFSQNPISTVKNVVMTPHPEVRVADFLGNYVTTQSPSVNITLQTVSGSGVLTGTLSKTMNSGATNFSDLKIDAAGTYNLKVTSTSPSWTLTSPNFEIVTSTPRNVTTALEMLQGPIFHNSTSKLNYPRSKTTVGLPTIDGSVNYELQIVAKNTDTVADGNVYLRFTNSPTGLSYSDVTLSVAGSKIIVPKNTTLPTLYSATISTSPSAALTYLIGAQYGNMTIYSAKLIAKQSGGAYRSSTYIPLSLNGSSTEDSLSTTTTTKSSSMASPNDINFPAYQFNKSRFDNVTSAKFIFAGKSFSTSTTSCASLWNKTTNTEITESCIQTSFETYKETLVSAASLPSDAELEVRFKSSDSTSTARLYRAGLMLNYVGINDHTTLEIASPSLANMTVSKAIDTHRFQSFYGGYTALTLNQYLKCRVKTNSSGTASLSLKDYGATSGATTPNSTISASTINLSNQTLANQLNAGPAVTTNDNYLMLDFNRSSGDFSIAGCLFETEANY